MSEPDQPNHWASLASELGAEIKPEQEAAKRPSASPPAQRERPKLRQAEPAQRHRPASNWDMVAADLGLPAPPRDDVRERLPQDRPAEIRPAEQVRPFDEDEYDTGVHDLVATHEDASHAAPGGGDERGEGEERPQRRRRRRRGGRGRRDEGRRRPDREEDSEEAALETLPDREQSASEALMSEMMIEAAADIVGAENGESFETISGEIDEETSERPRRRRRRRRGRDREGRARTDEPRAEPTRAQPAEDQEDLLADDEHDLEPEGDEAVRAVHKGIPSWRETIDHIITVNLAARAKNPRGSSGPPRRGNSGRGGRHRGRSSGG